MAKLARIHLACILFLSALMQFSFANSAKESLMESVTFFDKGHYKKALEMIRELDIRTDLDSSEDMKLAFKIRAISYEQTGDRERAQETIRELLFLDSDYQFNPFDTPNTVVALAQKEKAAIDAKNKQMAAIKSEAQIDHNSKAPVVLDKIIYIEKKPHFATTLFPLGLNHFYLDSPLKGGLYLSMQMLGLTTNIAAFWWKQSYLDSFGSPRLKDHNYEGRFKTAQMIQYIALGTLVASYCASVIDALIRFNSLEDSGNGISGGY